jgi:hypothetical protein
MVQKTEITRLAVIKHLAERHPIDDARLNSKANDSSRVPVFSCPVASAKSDSPSFDRSKVVRIAGGDTHFAMMKDNSKPYASIRQIARLPLPDPVLCKNSKNSI